MKQETSINISPLIPLWNHRPKTPNESKQPHGALMQQNLRRKRPPVALLPAQAHRCFENQTFDSIRDARPSSTLMRCAVAIAPGQCLSLALIFWEHRDRANGVPIGSVIGHGHQRKSYMADYLTIQYSDERDDQRLGIAQGLNNECSVWLEIAKVLKAAMVTSAMTAVSRAVSSRRTRCGSTLYLYE